MGTFSDTDRTVLRIPRSQPEGGPRTAEEALRAEIRAWASWKHDPTRFEAELLAVHGLAPLDEPAAGKDRPTPKPAPEPAADPMEHGTTRGARRHRERGERPCDPCLVAARVADRRYKAAARTRKPVAQ
jgi:hypothetical protein